RHEPRHGVAHERMIIDNQDLQGRGSSAGSVPTRASCRHLPFRAGPTGRFSRTRVLAQNRRRYCPQTTGAAVKQPSRSANLVIAVISAGVLSAMAAPGAAAQDGAPEGAVRITTDDLKWKPGRVPGHEIAPMLGDSTKPGPYTERVKFPPN